MLLPLAFLRRYFLKVYKDWVSFCSNIRVWNPPPVEIGKMECSVHLYSSPWLRPALSTEFKFQEFISWSTHETRRRVWVRNTNTIFAFPTLKKIAFEKKIGAPIRGQSWKTSPKFQVTVENLSSHKWLLKQRGK